MMTVGLHALVIDGDLLAQPADWWHGTVHSAFPSVVNVQPAHGLLWCAAARSVPAGPRTIVTDAPHGMFAHLCPGTTVRADEGSVAIGDDLRIALRGARGWSPPPPPHAPPEARRLLVFTQTLARLQVPGGAVAAGDPFSRAIAERVGDALAAIAAAMHARSSRNLDRAVRGLVGLGIGLTPTGDDVLTGFAYASRSLGGPLAMAPAVIAGAVSDGGTHLISATAILEACRGRAPQSLSDALRFLCGSGDEEDAGAVVSRLVSLGHTSGTDQASGLLSAVQIMIQ